jgi:hypothetical protein
MMRMRLCLGPKHGVPSLCDGAAASRHRARARAARLARYVPKVLIEIADHAFKRTAGRDWAQQAVALNRSAFTIGAGSEMPAVGVLR